MHRQLSVAISKLVGWDREPCNIPTREEVEDALIKKSYFRILYWVRYCKSPMTDEEVAIINEIAVAMPILRQEVNKEDA